MCIRRCLSLHCLLCNPSRSSRKCRLKLRHLLALLTVVTLQQMFVVVTQARVRIALTDMTSGQGPHHTLCYHSPRSPQPPSYLVTTDCPNRSISFDAGSCSLYGFKYENINTDQVLFVYLLRLKNITEMILFIKTNLPLLF